MDIVISLINTVILLVIFFYQRNRNKLLNERISQQQQLLQDTRAVISQQSVAMSGQSDIVKTAMEYSKVFDASKIEAIVRREINIEKTVEFDRIKKDYEKKLNELKLGAITNTKTEIADSINGLIYSVANEVANVVLEIFKEPFTFFLTDLISKEKQQQEDIIESLKNSQLKEFVRYSLKRVDTRVSEIEKSLANMFDKDKLQKITKEI